MKWNSYYKNLSRGDREDYARRVGTTSSYIEIHYLAPISRRKTPQKKNIQALALASDGICSVADVLSYFYGSSLETQDAA